MELITRPGNIKDNYNTKTEVNWNTSKQTDETVCISVTIVLN